MPVSFPRSARNAHTFPTSPIALEEYTIPLLHDDAWIEQVTEGELAVDVHETPACFVIQSTIAGVEPHHLTLALHRDLLTIRGKRAPHALPEGSAAVVQECYWGPFSRSVLLPEPVDVPRATATLRSGMLTITLPKLVERTDITVTSTE